MDNDKVEKWTNRLARWCGEQGPFSPRVDGRDTNQRQAEQWALDTALVTSDCIELLDNIRDGHKMYELWYSDAQGNRTPNSASGTGELLEPGGPASDLAEIIIRCLHIAHRERINIGHVIVQKLLFSDTRGAHHGGKMF